MVFSFCLRSLSDAITQFSLNDDEHLGSSYIWFDRNKVSIGGLIKYVVEKNKFNPQIKFAHGEKIYDASNEDMFPVDFDFTQKFRIELFYLMRNRM